MTNEEIKQLPEIVDTCLDGAILDEVRQHLNEKIDKVCQLAIQALESSIPIPPNATNGDVIKAVFPKVNKYNNILLEDGRKNILFGDDWWNAPYREGEK
jgi:hypothetical protein